MALPVTEQHFGKYSIYLVIFHAQHLLIYLPYFFSICISYFIEGFFGNSVYVDKEKKTRKLYNIGLIFSVILYQYQSSEIGSPVYLVTTHSTFSLFRAK